MRLSALIASDPWTLLITLVDDPDSLGLIAQFRALDSEGRLVDSWEVAYPRLEEAQRALEQAYGIDSTDWIDLEV
jgi:hypothetical protein